MAEQENEGTLEPTQRRREEARKDGQVVSSPDVAATFAVFAGCLFFMWFGPELGQRLMGGFRTWFREVPDTDWTMLHTQLGARWFTSEIAATCGGLLLLLMLLGLLIGFSQVGFLISWKPMELDVGKMSPIKGWQRLFSMESAIRGGLGIAKVLFLLIVSSCIIWFRRAELSTGNFESVGGLFTYAWNLGLTICLSLAGMSASLAAIDYIARWLQHEKKLKMTHQEIKQEQKDEMGDPTVKAAVRRRQREAMKSRSVSEVADATVVLTNPTHYAVALKYEQGSMTAPVLVAKGAGEFAFNIMRIAKENRVPVIRRPPLTRAIFRSVKPGQEIPVHFFRAVAEILGQIYKARRSAA